MRDEYDVIVVGAGPAGSVAAKTAAEGGLSVLLIEKRQEIGEPVRCAEGVSAEALAAFVKPDTKWICARINTARLFSPSGKRIEITEKNGDAAYILDRKIFDRELSMQAAKAGVDVYTKTQAVGVFKQNGEVCGIKGRQFGESFEARARLVIAADGIESRIARMAGIDTTLRLDDIGSCVQYHLTGIDNDPHCSELHFGRRKVPGGYVWVFPKGDHEANVGLGTLRHNGRRRPIDWLNDFIERRFPGAEVIGTMAGAVPAAGRIPVLSGGGILLAGDAGRLCDPVTGEGIINGMISGRTAGNVAIDAIVRGDLSATSLRQYETEIDRLLGPSLRRNHLIKRYLRTASDLEMNIGLGFFRATKVGHRTLNEVMREFFTPKNSSITSLVRYMSGI